MDFEREGSVHDPYGLFPGYFQIILNSRSPIDELYKNQWVDVGKVAHATDTAFDNLIPNQCVYLAFEDKDTLAIYKKNEAKFRLVPKPKINGDVDKSIKGVQPRNCEQAFAYSLLTDPNIAVVALVGNAGPGKTLMSLLAGYRQLKNEFDRSAKSPDSPRGATYNRIMVFRPTVEMGEKLGFLPGSLEEKIEPWMYPIFDNMDLILEHSSVDAKGTKQYDPIVDLIDRNVLQILPINHIRGRSIHDTFMIIDEAQNFTGDKLRSLITRAGSGTKVVLTGDITQIDDPYMDEYSNGLSHVISNFIGQEIFGYIIMEHGEERSLLAKLAAELL
jgi:PhoH-like ATPase